MKIGDLPKEIQRLVREEQTHQRKPVIVKFPEMDISSSSVLEWGNTRDGRDFWNEIAGGNFKPFYDKYSQWSNWDNRMDRAIKTTIEKEKEDLKILEDEVFNFLKN